MIPPDLEELLEPLERFEAIRRKVAKLGDRLCDLSYANPYEGVSDAVRAAIRASLDDERLLDLQYSPFGGGRRSPDARSPTGSGKAMGATSPLRTSFSRPAPWALFTLRCARVDGRARRSSSPSPAGSTIRSTPGSLASSR